MIAAAHKAIGINGFMLALSITVMTAVVYAAVP
jgi:hypothetical protein